mgnify:CR=1 FL=1
MGSLEEVYKLIEIPSVTGNERKVGDYLESRFREIGCSTERYKVTENRYNILARFEGSEEGRLGLLFHGHMDTVDGMGMPSPYEPKTMDGQVYGRGSVDQKGGIAAVIEAFERYTESGRRPKKPFAFVAVIDEESEHRGSMALKEMGIEAEFAVVTEPTGLKVGIGCKGTIPLRLHVKGKAAHGCRPWLGVNAVVAGMDMTQELMSQELSSYEIEGVAKVQSSINLGLIRGGTAYNNVADTCDVWFDRRVVPGEDPKEVLEKYRSIVACGAETHGVEAGIEVSRPDWNWEPIIRRGLLPALTDMDTREFELAVEAHRRVEKEDPKIFFTDGYQEMDFLINDLHINAIQYGPGDSKLVHTDHEHLDIRDLRQCSSVFLRMIELMCE